MFILTVGLLSLAALIPVSGHSLKQAAIADNAATLGRAALRDVRIRGYLHPGTWVNPLGVGAPWMDPDLEPPSIQLSNPLDGANSICIDPLFVARNSTVAGVSVFPFSLNNDPLYNGPQLGAPIPNVETPRMQRVTLSNGYPIGHASWGPQSPEVADRIFRGHDDVIFTLPDDPTLRPRAMQNPATGAQQFTGDYSWLITVTPAIGMGGVPSAHRTQYTVTIVVFHQRDLIAPEFDLSNRIGAAPTERMVYADMLDGGFGGGSVLLRLPFSTGQPNATTQDPERSDLPEVRPGQWIMLCGWVDDLPPSQNTVWYNPAGVAQGPIGRRAVFKWYRVVAVDEERLRFDSSPLPGADGEWQQMVTLQGPDWETGQIADADGDATFPTAHAALIQGVVAVYEKTMSLDTSSGF